MFDKNTFIDFLKCTNGCNPDQITKCIKVVEDFQAFLTERGIKSEQNITTKDIQDYVIARREQVEDISRIINILNEYFFAVKNDLLCNELWLLLDAIGILRKMSDLTKNELGEDIWQQVFGDVQIPEIGWTLDEITNFTRQMHKNLCKVASLEQIESMYQKNAHAYQQSFDGTPREILEAKGIDGLLKHNHDDFIKEMEKCRDNGDYNGFIIDDEVINFYRENPMSYRIDNKIIMRQEPVFTKQYLHETDEKLKRYYACHCPIKKKSIMQDEGGLPRSLCYCCFGHNKQQIESAFGRELNGRVIKSVMEEGCLQCVYEIDIPQDIMECYT